MPGAVPRLRGGGGMDAAADGDGDGDGAGEAELRRLRASRLRHPPSGGAAAARAGGGAAGADHALFWHHARDEPALRPRGGAAGGRAPTRVRVFV